MTKNQRKQHLKELKAKAKAAKRAQNAGAADDAGGAPATHGDAGGAPAIQAPATHDPVLHARGAMKLAEVAIDDSKQPDVTDKQARAMLHRAACFLSDVVALVDDAIKAASPEERREALEIRNSKPAPSDTPAQKRARRGANVLVTLMNLGSRAANLMQRILNVTNPNVVKLARTA